MSATAILLSDETDADRRIESLLIELSTRFINLPSDQIDHEIQSAQRQICECLGLDRSALWQQSPEKPDSFLLSHIHQSPDGPPPTMQADARDFFPWTLQQLQQGKTIAIARLDEIPEEGARDRETFRRFGTNSTVVVPLLIGGETLGGLTFASFTEREEWPEPTVRRLQLVAEVFTNAIARQRIDGALKQSREAYALAIDGANDGLWDWNILTNRVFFAPRCKSMLGYEDHEIVNHFSAWEELLHPEDRENALANLKKYLSQEISVYEAEYRLRHKDGSYRWILARGKAVWDLENRPYRMAGSYSDITPRKLTEVELRNTLGELRQLRDQLHQENVYLRQEMRLLHKHGRFVGRSRAIKKVLAEIEQVAPTNSTVLLLGETGTGKELLASAIHELSSRGTRPMVKVNCAAIPSTLIESELFGREKGAYTGAISRQIGRFELADASTLFLDEIGELPSDVQVKLLRVLEDKRVERLGSSKATVVDVRIVAATNRDLEKAVRDGQFRQDLYYRLNVFPIMVPPLRDRRDDIPVLVSALVDELNRTMGRKVESVAKESMEALQRYDWPGNVRELRNQIERAMIMAKGPRLWIEPPTRGSDSTAPHLSLREIDTDHIRHVLEMASWRIRGAGGAAEILKLKPTTLETKMAKLGIARPRNATE